MSTSTSKISCDAPLRETPMRGDRSYTYGWAHGETYEQAEFHESDDGKSGGKDVVTRTHWDPRVEVITYPEVRGLVRVGVVPPTPFDPDNPRNRPVDSVEFDGPSASVEWLEDNGQFLNLDREGLNRLIESLQEAGARVFGRDRW